MTNTNITPKAMAIIILAMMSPEVGGFMIKIPEQLLQDAQIRAANFAIQYSVIAIGQVAAGQGVDAMGPTKLLSWK